MKRARRLFILVSVLLASGGTVAAAFWTAAGSGSATATVGTLHAPTRASASAAPGSSTVLITWTASKAASGLEPTGYYILRHESGGETSAACGSLPRTLVDATTCSDKAVADGSYTYTVVARYASWTAASTPSSAVKVVSDNMAAALTLRSPADGSSTNSMTPTLSGAAGNATGDSSTVTVRIHDDTAKGGTDHQTLNVTRSGATWSTTTKLAQGTYTAQATQTDAAGNVATSSANTFTVDTTAPALSTLNMSDSNANGKIDRVTATFTEPLQTSTTTAPWTLTNVPSSGTLGAVSTSGTVATLTITEGSGAADTSVGTFKAVLAANTSDIRDAAGNQAGFKATAPADLAAPVLMTVSANDHRGNGAGLMQHRDTLVMTFSEALARRSVPDRVTVIEARSADTSTLTIPGLINSAPIRGARSNKTRGSGSSSSTVVLSDRTVTATVGVVTEAPGGLKEDGGSAQIVPAATLTDRVGIAAAATPQSTGSGSPLF